MSSEACGMRVIAPVLRCPSVRLLRRLIERLEGTNNLMGSDAKLRVRINKRDFAPRRLHDLVGVFATGRSLLMRTLGVRPTHRGCYRGMGERVIRIVGGEGPDALRRFTHV